MRDMRNLFLKDKIRWKDKVTEFLLENFSNHVPDHSNYIISKSTEVSTQKDSHPKNNIQTSTASNNHCTTLASAKEIDKNQKKLNISKS